MRVKLSTLPDIMAWWTFDYVPGPLALDRSPYNSPLIIVGASPIDAVITGGRHGDGINDWMRNPSLLQSITSIGSFDFFARFPTPASDEYILHMPRQSLTEYIRLGRLASNRFELIIEDSNVQVTIILTNTLISDTYWHHFYIGQDGVKARIFIDGLESTVIGTNSTYWTSHLTNPYFSLFRSGWGYAEADLDNFIIYNRFLDDATILRHSQRRYSL